MIIRRIIYGFGTNVYDKIVISGIQLIILPVFVTCWGIHTYGAWVLLATIPSFLAMSDLGFATAAGTRMIMCVAKGNREEAIRVFQTAWAMVLASTIIVTIVALSITWLLPAGVLPQSENFDGEQSRIALSMLILYGLISLQGSILASGFRSAGYYPLATFLNANTFLVENLGAIATALLGGSPVHAAGALLIFRSLALAGQTLLLRVRVRWLDFGFSHTSLDEVKTLSGPALGVTALPFGQASFLQGTALALGAAAGEAAVPAFAAARTLSRVGMQMSYLIVHAMMPEFSAAVAREDKVAKGAILLTTLVCNGLILVPLAICLGIYGPEIVALWTGGIVHASQSLMFVMMVSAVLGGLWSPLATIILAMNQHTTYAYPFAVFSLLTIPVAYILSIPFGATGAGLSIVLLDVAMCILITRLAKRFFAGQVDMRTALRLFVERVLRFSNVG